VITNAHSCKAPDDGMTVGRIAVTNLPQIVHPPDRSESARFEVLTKICSGRCFLSNLWRWSFKCRHYGLYCFSPGPWQIGDGHRGLSAWTLWCA
jgi:hypothetical protein